MITFEEAKAKALEVRPDVNEVNEWTNAYIFKNDEDMLSFGGETMPVIILKENGEPIHSLDYNSGKYGEPEFIGSWKF